MFYGRFVVGMRASAVPACLILVSVVSCGGEGTLTVRTAPVRGTVVVDGVPRGEAPVTLVLKAGEHEVSFADYSGQFTPPKKRNVRIEPGRTVEIAGKYVDRLVPEVPPPGFSPADSVRYYGTKERKLKDGTIFDYIDGGALVYLRHGLCGTTHVLFRDDGGDEIVLDIFDMGNPVNAERAFRDEEICPAGFETLDIGGGCKSYHYEPDFLLYFHKSRYLVFLSTTSDSLRETLVSYAREVESRI